MKQNEYIVNVSDRTAKMLASHAAFIAQVNRSAAQKFVVAFEEAAKSLRLMPHRCSWLQDEYLPKNKYRILVFENRYMIIFQIKDNTVYIEYILDCRQDNSFPI